MRILLKWTKTIFTTRIPPSESNSESIDSEILENRKGYLKTNSQEEISEIFEDVHKILEGRDSQSRFQKASEEEIPINKKKKIKNITRNAFRSFSETASCRKKQIIGFSRVAISKASSIASERTESRISAPKKLNENGIT